MLPSLYVPCEMATKVSRKEYKVFSRVLPQMSPQVSCNYSMRISVRKATSIQLFQVLLSRCSRSANCPPKPSVPVRAGVSRGVGRPSWKRWRSAQQRCTGTLPVTRRPQASHHSPHLVRLVSVAASTPRSARRRLREAKRLDGAHTAMTCQGLVDAERSAGEPALGFVWPRACGPISSSCSGAQWLRG